MKPELRDIYMRAFRDCTQSKRGTYDLECSSWCRDFEEQNGHLYSINLNRNSEAVLPSSRSSLKLQPPIGMLPVRNGIYGLVCDSLHNGGIGLDLVPGMQISDLQEHSPSQPYG